MTVPATNLEPAEAQQSPRDALRKHVSRRAAELQRQYLAQALHATATLARLRRALTTEPGGDPSVWQATLGDLDHRLVGRGDEPSAGERAVHVALCLFAIHQQSQRTEMHKAGVGLGSAVRSLAGRETTSAQAVERRFHALGTSQSFDEAAHHARGLVTQLRSHAIALDYGRLAVDLYDLQSQHREDRVRRNWGRDYYRTPPTDQPSADRTNGADQ